MFRINAFAGGGGGGRLFKGAFKRRGRLIEVIRYDVIEQFIYLHMVIYTRL